MMRPLPIRIAMVSFYFLPEYSGAARQATRLINRLRKYDVHFTVISARIQPEWPEQEVIDGVEIIRVPVKGTRALLPFWFRVARVLWQMRSAIDLVHVNGMRPAHGFPVWFAHLLGKPAMGKLSIANSDIDFTHQGRLIGTLNRWFLDRGSAYVAISSALKTELQLAGLDGRKCATIPNGVDRQTFFQPTSEQRRAVRGRLGLGEDLVVLFVGVIDRRKGVDVLIRSFQTVAAEHPDAKLLLVGPKNRNDSGTHFYQSMVTLAKALGLNGRVVFRGFSEEVAPYYQAADLFVLPSLQEGMPNVIVEAMACGTPVVGTRISGSEDIIDDGVNGLLVPPDDPRSLGEAISAALKDPGLRSEMSRQGLAKVAAVYDLDKVAASYYGLICGLLGGSPGAAAEARRHHGG